MYKMHLEEGHSPPCTATRGAALTDSSAGPQTKGIKNAFATSLGGTRGHQPSTQNWSQFSFHKAPKLPSEHEFAFLSFEKDVVPV